MQSQYTFCVTVCLNQLLVQSAPPRNVRIGISRH